MLWCMAYGHLVLFVHGYQQPSLEPEWEWLWGHGGQWYLHTGPQLRRLLIDTEDLHRWVEWGTEVEYGEPLLGRYHRVFISWEAGLVAVVSIMGSSEDGGRVPHPCVPSVQ